MCKTKPTRRVRIDAGRSGDRSSSAYRRESHRLCKTNPIPPRLTRSACPQDRLHSELLADEAGVQVAAADQLVVAAVLDDVAVLHHEDAVGVADRAEAVCDDETRAADHQAGQRF